MRSLSSIIVYKRSNTFFRNNSTYFTKAKSHFQVSSLRSSQVISQSRMALDFSKVSYNL